MSDWDFSPPDQSDLGDHDVPLLSTNLLNKRIALLLTGGIATIKAPFISRALRRHGADVVVFASEEAMRYTTIDALEWSSINKVVTNLSSKAEHLSDDAPFDAYLVAPATYNTINKMAAGIADTVITTTLGSALGRMERGKTKILIAPTMHGTLHNRILTESLKKLADLGVEIIKPRDAYGKHNIPHEKILVAEVCRSVSKSLLKGKSILVTGGPTPVKIDNVRRITNRFRGKLGVEITAELYLRGADVFLIHGDGAFRPPEHLPFSIARTYEEYRENVNNELSNKNYDYGIFSAAVADYQPEEVQDGKIPSGGLLKNINLIPTKKIIDEVRKSFPELTMITFKYQENVTHEELLSITQRRLKNGDTAIIANRGEEIGEKGEQIAWLISKNNEPLKLTGKKDIAAAIADFLEKQNM